MSTPKPEQWSLASRVAFRFAFLYFGLFCLTTQVLTGLLPIPGIDLPDPSVLPPVRQIVFFAAAHVFRVATPLVYTGSGSGDKTFDWVLAFCLLSISVIGTVLWSALDRRRRGYTALHSWFHLFLRFALGSQMVLYGTVKLVPMQMPYPFLTKLLEPFGNFSPMGVLWFSVGSSPAYESFAGAAEMLAGILIFFPRTATLGALLALADTTEVFVLNMTYDVPVKLFSAHLILMSLVLLAPERRRLAAFFFSDRTVGPSPAPRPSRLSLQLQAGFALLLVAANGYGAWKSWHTYGGGAPKSPLYGIWNVETNPAPWRRVIFDRPASVTFQRPDDTFAGYAAIIDTLNGSIILTQGTGNRNGDLKFDRIGQDGLTLDGQMDGQRLHLDLRLFDRSKLPLVSRGFHWIQEYPFNR